MDNWFSDLKNHLVTYSFDNHANKFKGEALNWLEQLELDSQKLQFISRFIDLDNGLLPHMLYKTKDWKQQVTIDLYSKIYENPNSLKRSKRIAISFLFSHEYIVPEMTQLLMTWMQEDNDWDAFDILHRYPFVLNREQRELMYGWMHQNRYRQENNVVAVGIPNAADIFHSVYDDNQNVHNTQINDSVWKNIKILQQEFNEFPITDEDCESMKRIQRFEYHHHSAILRIETDRSLFSRDNLTINLKTVLKYIFSYISRQPENTQQELFKRFLEELADMSETCASGHLSRLVNILVGYHPLITIEISEHERIKAAFNNLLQKMVLLNENSDLLLVEMTEPSSNNLFVNFMKRNKEIIIKDMITNLELDRSILEEYLPKIWSETYPQHNPNPFVRQRLFPRIRQIINNYLEFFKF